MISRLFIVLILSVLLLMAPFTVFSAIVNVWGDITSDTVWTSGDSIRIIDNMTIDGSGSLTIEPGAVVMFSPGLYLSVNGIINADGNESEHILFTCSSDTVGGSPYAGSWRGIELWSNSVSSFSFCDFRNAVNTIQAYSVSASLRNCTIENFSVRGLYLDGYISNPPVSVFLDHCIIRQQDPNVHGIGTGIYVFRSVDLTVDRCEVGNCSYGLDICAYQTYSPYFTITNSEIHDQTTRGIYLHTGG